MLSAILGHDNTPSLDRFVAKGQLYNLEWDESLSFQFNPENVEWVRESQWARASHRGQMQMAKPYFIATEPREMEIPFLFIADPGAPAVEFKSNNSPLVARSAFDKSGPFGFKELRSIIESWETVIETIGRPSRIRVIFGDIAFDCYTKRSRFKITEFFSQDLAVREGLITLELMEW